MSSVEVISPTVKFNRFPDESCIRQIQDVDLCPVKDLTMERTSSNRLSKVEDIDLMLT